jgi:hypothetical protein
VSPSLPKLADPTAVIRAGGLPERTVPICLALDLVEEYEELLREAEQPAESNSLAGSPKKPTAELDALKAQMLASTVEFRLRAMPRPKFKALKRDHPPRKGEDGAPVPRDAMLGVNEDTFFEPLLRASLVDPVLDETTFRLLVDEKLSDGQFEQLTDVAWALNVRRIDLPFSYAGSKTTTSSDAG